MMRKILFALILLSVFTISCKKKEASATDCIEHELGKNVLSDQDLSINPYKTNDSLIFINEKINSSYVFICDSRLSDHSVYSENTYYNGGQSQCKGNYNMIETNYTTFHMSDNQEIFVTINSENPLSTGHKNKGIFFLVGLPVDSIEGFSGYYLFNNDSLMSDPHIPGVQVEQFFDTLTISGKQYKKVYKLSGYGSPYMDHEKISTIYYSVMNGILRFSTTKNNVWDLEAKKIF